MNSLRPSRKFRFTIPVKVSFLVFATVVVSVLAFAIFIFTKVKHEEEKAYAQTVSSLGLVMGEQLLHVQDEIKRDMTNILALIDPAQPNKSVDSIRIILQKNPQFIYFELSKITSGKKSHRELLSLFNENTLLRESISRDEIRLQIERNIDEFSREDVKHINYHFESFPKEFPIYIFDLARKEKLFAAFALSKDLFLKIHSPTSPVDVILLNSNMDVLFESVPNFPSRHFATQIEGRSANQGLFEKFQDPSGKYAVHFYRAADGITFLTFKNLQSAGLDIKSFSRDVVFFIGIVSVVMLLISFAFSKGLSLRIQRLMGVTENIAAGNYEIGTDMRARDEVGQLADQFKLLRERLGENKDRMEKVREQANRDGLTGVYNQRYFRERMEQLFVTTREEGKHLSLILLDIDHYKKFNDEYGHQQGDIVIQQIAHLLLTMTRKSDLVARYGGDEFAVLLVNTDPVVARQIADRIRETFQHKRISRYGEEGTLSGTCSLGVASYDGKNMKSPDELLKTADDFLYKAKRNGRNQVYSGPEYLDPVL